MRVNPKLNIVSNFQKVSKAIRRKPHRAPKPNELEADIPNSTKILAELGLKQSNQWLPAHEDSRKFLNFTSPLGVLQYLRIPAGLQATEEILGEVIGKIFKAARKVKLVHDMDKIVLCATNIADLEGQMREVVRVAEEFGVVFNNHRIKVGEQQR